VIRRVARDVTEPEAVAVLQIFRACPLQAELSATTCPVPLGSDSDSASWLTGAAVAEEAVSASMEAAAMAASELFTLGPSASRRMGLSGCVRSRGQALLRRARDGCGTSRTL
jgi:hypothetical protein